MLFRYINNCHTPLKMQCCTPGMRRLSVTEVQRTTQLHVSPCSRVEEGVTNAVFPLRCFYHNTVTVTLLGDCRLFPT